MVINTKIKFNLVRLTKLGESQGLSSIKYIISAHEVLFKEKRYKIAKLKA